MKSIKITERRLRNLLKTAWLDGKNDGMETNVDLWIDDNIAILKSNSYKSDCKKIMRGEK